MGWRLPGYWLWLLAEIVKANIDIAKRVVDPSTVDSSATARSCALDRYWLDVTGYRRSPRAGGYLRCS